jgi:hypothetical protein
MQTWQQRFDNALLHLWNLTKASGLGPIELHTWQVRYPRAPEEAAASFGEKYDLTPSAAFRGW